MEKNSHLINVFSIFQGNSEFCSCKKAYEKQKTNKGIFAE